MTKQVRKPSKKDLGIAIGAAAIAVAIGLGVFYYGQQVAGPAGNAIAAQQTAQGGNQVKVHLRRCKIRTLWIHIIFFSLVLVKVA